MKKIILIICIFCFNFSFSQVKIYCKPDIEKCISNLQNLDYWLSEDAKEDKISYEIWKEYELVVTHTISSLEMILEDKGQCDTTESVIEFSDYLVGIKD